MYITFDQRVSFEAASAPWRRSPCHQIVSPGYMTGKMKKTKSTMQDGGEGRSVFTMYDVKDDGTEFMTMRLTYIRKK